MKNQLQKLRTFAKTHKDEIAIIGATVGVTAGYIAFAIHEIKKTAVGQVDLYRSTDDTYSVVVLGYLNGTTDEIVIPHTFEK